MKDTLTSSSPCAFSLSDGCPSRSWAAAFRPKPIANWLSDAECKLRNGSLSLSLSLSLSFSLFLSSASGKSRTKLGHSRSLPRNVSAARLYSRGRIGFLLSCVRLDANFTPHRTLLAALCTRTRLICLSCVYVYVCVCASLFLSLSCSFGLFVSASVSRSMRDACHCSARCSIAIKRQTMRRSVARVNGFGRNDGFIMMHCISGRRRERRRKGEVANGTTLLATWTSTNE